jgi:hypothetical protein
MNTTNNTLSVGTVLSLVCKRWDSKPWELEELVAYKVKVERETEKAVLLVDETSPRRRSTWMPKKALKGDKSGCLSSWANGKLDSAGFGETDVFSIPGR